MSFKCGHHAIAKRTIEKGELINIKDMEYFGIVAEPDLLCPVCKRGVAEMYLRHKRPMEKRQISG